MYMKVYISFNYPNPIINGTTFGGMVVSNYKRSYDENNDTFTETCFLTENHEWYMPTLLATIATEMKYWNKFRIVTSVTDLQSLIENTFNKYTPNLNKCMEWDDFDDFFTLLIITMEKIKSGQITSQMLQYFNFDE